VGVQTGQVVAIKKIRLGKAKEVRLRLATWLTNLGEFTMGCGLIERPEAGNLVDLYGWVQHGTGRCDSPFPKLHGQLRGKQICLAGDLGRVCVLMCDGIFLSGQVVHDSEQTVRALGKGCQKPVSLANVWGKMICQQQGHLPYTNFA
jgi:hypothetical protein